MQCISQSALWGTVLSLLLSSWCALCCMLFACQCSITLTLCHCPVWYALLPSPITLCIHGQPSSLCTATVDPKGKSNVNLCKYHCPFKYFFSTQLEGLIGFHPLSLQLNGSSLIWGSRALIDLLTWSVAGLGNPTPVGIDLTCNNARLTSLLLPKHYFMVCMPSTCLLLSWWYDEVIAWSMFSCMQIV